MKDKKRYLLAIDFFIYAEDDEKAIELSEKIISDKNKKEDNQTRLIVLYEFPFGTLTNRPIKIERSRK